MTFKNRKGPGESQFCRQTDPITNTDLVKKKHEKKLTKIKSLN